MTKMSPEEFEVKLQAIIAERRARDEKTTTTKMSAEEFEVKLQAMIAERQARDDECRMRITRQLGDLCLCQQPADAQHEVRPVSNAALSVLMHVLM